MCCARASNCSTGGQYRKIEKDPQPGRKLEHLEMGLWDIPILGVTKEMKIMEEKQEDTAEEQLPPCTTAPAAEHARAHDEDEPCEDGRAGVIAKE